MTASDRTARPPPSRRPRTPPRVPMGSLGAIVLVAVLAFGSLPSAVGQPSVGAPASGAISPVLHPSPATAAANSGAAVFWSHPWTPGTGPAGAHGSSRGSGVPGAPYATPTGMLGAPPPPPPPPFATDCSAPDSPGLNFSVTVAPATSGDPRNLSYEVEVYSGLPPFDVQGSFQRSTYQGTYWDQTNSEGNATYAYVTFGNATIGEPGYVPFWFTITDSTCDQGVTLGAWTEAVNGSAPVVTVTASNASGPAPLHETFTVHGTPGLVHADFTVVWSSDSPFATPGVLGTETSLNQTFLQNGTWEFSACVVRDSDRSYWGCSAPSNVTVTGPSTLQLEATRSPGTSPVNVSVWLNVTDPSVLPTSGYVYEALGNAHGPPLFNRSGPGTPASYRLNETLTCATFTPSDTGTWATTSVCQELAFRFDFSGGPSNDSATGELLMNIAPAPGSIPSVRIGLGPLGGVPSAPVAAQLSASGGGTTFGYNLTIFGKTNRTAGGGDSIPGALGPTGTFLPDRFVTNLTGWNGANVSVPIPLPVSGVYWISGAITDPLLAGLCAFYTPIFPYLVSNGSQGNATPGPTVVDTECGVPNFGYLGGIGPACGASPLGNSSGGINASINCQPPAPLLGQAGASNRTGADVVGVLGAFWINMTSGTGPFTVTWRFGDGTSSESTSLVPEFSVEHVYGMLGAFAPSATVVDVHGMVLTERFPLVVVTASELPRGSTRAAQGGIPTPGGWALVVVVGSLAVVAVALGALAAERDRRRMQELGESYVAGFAEPLEDAEPPTGKG